MWEKAKAGCRINPPQSGGTSVGLGLMKNIDVKSLAIGILLTFSVLATSCSSIEARSKGAAKPFPGIRFMSDSRHSVYGAEGWMAPKSPEPEPKTDDSCDWVTGIVDALATSGFNNEDDFAFFALCFYAPIDFTATLGLNHLKQFFNRISGAGWHCESIAAKS